MKTSSVCKAALDGTAALIAVNAAATRFERAALPAACIQVRPFAPFASGRDRASVSSSASHLPHLTSPGVKFSMFPSASF
jgi:hypothetical protein